ncbi:MAG: molybdopterin adenylyltransferase [Vulcanimicrobiota bacterium]
MSIKIGLLTVSDRAHRGEYEDLGGPAMEAWLRAALSNPDVCFLKEVVPDEITEIVDALDRFAAQDCCLVLTTGGTGPAARDVTPEGTKLFCDRILDGFGEQMRRASLEVVPTAILSRQMAGTRDKTLVINLPGKPSAIDDCLRAVFPAVPYCIDLLEGPRLETRAEFIDCFRPQKKANG